MKSLGRNVKESLLIQKFLKTNNSHIFYFWDELSDEEKDQLINELNNIELNMFCFNSSLAIIDNPFICFLKSVTPVFNRFFTSFHLTIIGYLQ